MKVVMDYTPENLIMKMECDQAIAECREKLEDKLKLPYPPHKQKQFFHEYQEQIAQYLELLTWIEARTNIKYITIPMIPAN